MVITKDQVMQELSIMPNSFDSDELMERIFILSKLEKGRQDSREGKIYSMDDFRGKFAEWL